MLYRYLFSVSANIVAMPDVLTGLPRSKSAPWIRLFLFDPQAYFQNQGLFAR